MQHEVRFVLVGGYAARVHGSPMVTEDVDICLDFSPGNLLHLKNALNGLNPVHRLTPGKLPVVLNPENCVGLKNLYIQTSLGHLDCLSEVLSVGDYNECEKRSITRDLSGKPCKILSLDALITAKAALSRPRDRENVLHLKAIREKLQQN
ncbi:MAG: hypothetical protein PHD76_11955 [Methylacidiphilales bacterium]|nr:hypothetical protein [Candidatus Methylacidiphilales bacterium]